MTTDSEWTDWIPHVAGDPCPIPTVKAGEFELRFADGISEVGFFDASWWSVGWDSWRGNNKPGLNITHYRLRNPSPDWKGIADELATALFELLSTINAPETKRGSAARSDAASTLTRYHELIK